MRNYYLAERLKNRHTSAGKLIILMPLLSVCMAAWLTREYFAIDSYNWWYMGLFPAMLAFVCGAVGDRDKKLGNRAIGTLPADMGQIWDGKVLYGIRCMGIALAVFFCATVASEEGLEQMLHITFRIAPTFGEHILAVLVLFAASLWQVPFCLMLQQAIGIFPMVLLHMGTYILCSSSLSLKPFFMALPGGIAARLLCPVLKLLPNGLPAEPGSMTFTPELLEWKWMAPGIGAAVIWFFIFWILGRKWFERKIYRRQLIIAAAPSTATLWHLHIRASAHPPEGLYIWQFFNARYYRRAMRELCRLVRAEFWKIKHTLLPWIHVGIPLLGIAGTLLECHVSSMSEESKVFAYVQVLSVALPLLVSVICSMSVEMEEQGHFQTFLGTAVHKRNPLLAKWIVLSGMGFGSMILAVGGFAVGFRVMTGRMVYPAWEYLCVAAVLWLGGVNLYLIHLFLNLRFSRQISLCAGAAEIVLQALFLTGLGEGRWEFFPCTWGGRWGGYLLLYWKENPMISPGIMFRSLKVCVGVTVVLWGAVMVWFHFYEGRQCYD